jgi:hypothetical protein
MFRAGTALARRVSILHQGHVLVVHIARHNDWKSNLFRLFFFTAAFLFFCSIFLRGIFRVNSAVEILHLLPFIVFIIIWYLLALRIGLWRAFGVEDLTIDNGKLHWQRTAWLWRRRLDAPIRGISDVQAKTPWHALSNRVEFTCNGRRYAVGDMLLQNEATEIAHELQRAVGLH